MSYKYETHLHTSPVSKCAVATVEETVRAYHELGYDGIFITNHFLDGNCSSEIKEMSYEDGVRAYISDYRRAKALGDELGLKVFFAVELSYGGTDFLVYGLDEEWYIAHPEILGMTKKEELTFMAGEGALIIHAHPFREARYIDHIRLYPREVEGVEVVNGSRRELENRMAGIYCREYGLIPFAGSDNHAGGRFENFAGMECDEPVSSVAEFVDAVRSGRARPFYTRLEK